MTPSTRKSTTRPRRSSSIKVEVGGGSATTAAPRQAKTKNDVSLSASQRSTARKKHRPASSQPVSTGRRNSSAAASTTSSSLPKPKKTSTTTASVLHKKPNATKKLSITTAPVLGPCCLCHCALDFSNAEACQTFANTASIPFAKAATAANADTAAPPAQSTHSTELPSYYDACNALVSCDSCGRCYHRHCHFVPMLHIAQHNRSSNADASFTCLLCTSQSEDDSTNKQSTSFVSTTNWDALFQSPPIPAVAAEEAAWDCHAVVTNLKGRLLHTQLNGLKRTISNAIGRYQRSTATLETLTANARNRQHFLQSRRTGRASATISASAPTSADNSDDNSEDNGNTKEKFPAMSQELMQCIMARVTAQRALRRTVLSLERVQSSGVARKAWEELIEHYRKQKQQTESALIRDSISPRENGANSNNATAATGLVNIFPSTTIQPFSRRWTPLTPEYAANNPSTKSVEKDCVPLEIQVPASAKKSSDNAVATASQNNVAKDEDDDGISLDELQCCVCLKGECSDENDLLMCDGNGCYRAYHMECVHPHVLPEAVSEEHEDEDWFCPLCETLADVLYQIQFGTVGGEEWEERRRLARLANAKSKGAAHRDIDDTEHDSLASWADAADVFPEAEWAYETAILMQQGVHNTDTQLLLSQILGMAPQSSSPDDHDGPKEHTINNLDVNPDDDDDNVDEDGHFDMYSYQEERRIEREERHNGEDAEDDDSLSTRSSQVSLVELSSVELNVGKDELAALTDVESDDDDDGDADEGKRNVRQSRRLRGNKSGRSGPKNGTKGHTNMPKGENADPGKMDTANIISGKRKRKTVDYHRLNEAMFGDVAAEVALETLDGGDDFVFDGTNKAAFGSDDDDEEEEEEDDNDEEDTSEENDEDDDDDEEEEEDGDEEDVDADIGNGTKDDAKANKLGSAGMNGHASTRRSRRAEK